MDMMTVGLLSLVWREREVRDDGLGGWLIWRELGGSWLSLGEARLEMVYSSMILVQFLSFVCSTGGKGSKPRLWNLQNLGAVLYCTSVRCTPTQVMAGIVL